MSSDSSMGYRRAFNTPAYKSACEHIRRANSVLSDIMYEDGMGSEIQYVKVAAHAAMAQALFEKARCDADEC